MVVLTLQSINAPHHDVKFQNSENMPLGMMGLML
jgi:hypothetical protein